MSKSPSRPSTGKVNTTMLVIIMPPSTQEYTTVQSIRERYEPKLKCGYIRCGPHITLAYPFLPETQFEDTASQLQSALKNFKPFDVTLSTFSHFSQRNNKTFYLEPTTIGNELIELQGAIQREIPICDDVVKKSKRFVPHLSVATFDNFSELEVERQIIAKDWKPVTFHVKEIYLISRKGSANPSKFKIKNIVSLGSAVEPVTDPYFSVDQLSL
jgi:poly(A) polymerase